MKGWILYKHSMDSIEPDDYEIHRFLEEAKTENIELKIIKPEQLELIVTREGRKSILVDGENVDLPDFFLPRMGAGTTYFALAVIRHLERLGIYCINSSLSIEIAKDKMYSQQILAENDLPIPKTMLVKFPIDENLVEKYIGFPVIVKTLTGSLGSGIYLSESKLSFSDLMELIKKINKNANIILQEFIKTSRGIDLRVFTIGGRAIACMKRIAKDGDFKANFSRGGKVELFEITPEINWLATQTSNLFKLDIAGIDLLFSGDHYKICEANSSPGFKGLESCCGINIPREIFNFIRIRKGWFASK